MKFTLFSGLIFLVLIGVSFGISENHKLEYAAKFCGEFEIFCMNIEDGKISSSYTYDLPQSGNLSLSFEENRITCAYQDGRLIFDDICSKETLSAIKNLNARNVLVTIPGLQVESLSIGPVVSFLGRLGILFAESLWILLSDLVVSIVTIILGIFKL